MRVSMLNMTLPENANNFRLGLGSWSGSKKVYAKKILNSQIKQMVNVLKLKQKLFWSRQRMNL